MTLGSAATAQAARAPATITIDWSQSGNEFFYFGEISSPKQKCQSLRKITVYRKKNGDDEKIGSAKSVPDIFSPEEDYVWQVNTFDEPNGIYYAQAAKTNKCKKATSPSLALAPR